VFNEEEHPRDNNGKFTDKNGGKKKGGYDSRNDLGTIKNATKKTPTVKIVKVDMNADIQKQFDSATPQERVKIAFKYIMDNLRGKYPAEDGRVVAIEKVGADKMSHTLNETKIRVLPELAKLIEAGELEGIVDAQKDDGKSHRLFKKFAYYKVPFQIGKDKYIGRLNVGIRENGSSTLYDLNPFNKQ